MNTKRSILALSLAAPLALAGCDLGKKSGGTAASATATATAAPGAACPAGASLDSSSSTCKGSGSSRVATITWAGAVTDNGPTLTVKNTSSFGLKNATVSLWFYDKSGKRLDVAGAKKYSSHADVLGSSTFAAGASKDTSFNFMKANIPTGTAEIEGEIVAATLVKSDGTDGNSWKNDDINADERAMAGTPPPGAATPQYAAAPGTPAPPGAGTAATTATTKPTTTATATGPTRPGGAGTAAAGGATHKPGGPPPAPGHH